MTQLSLIDEGRDVRWIVWPQSEPCPEGAIQENGRYLFELSGDPLCANAELLIDDDRLEALRPKAPGTSLWRWTPGFNAGIVEGQIQFPGKASIPISFVTDPDARKLSRSRFDTMVSEILQDSLDLFSLGGFRTGISRGVGNRPPPIARLEFLRSRVDEIELAVRSIARQPRQRMAVDPVSLPYHKARRASGQDIARSLRSGRILREEGDPPYALPEVLAGALPALIHTRRRFSSTDTPENRQVLASLRYWSQWLLTTAEQFRAASGAENRAVTIKWARRCRSLAARLDRLTLLPAFVDVSAAAAEMRLTSVFRRDVAYRAFYGLWRDFNLGLANLQGEFLNIPLSETFNLYELWCYLRLVRAATASGEGSEATSVTGLFEIESGGGVVLSPVGAAATLPSVTILFQRSYREYWLERGGQGSFTRTMTPDIVVTTPGGTEGAKLIVLDAKYRVEQALNDAISSIHMYRDALVEAESVPGVRRVVDAAYVITPFAPVGLTDDFKRTDVPARFFHPGYRATFRLGALTMIPGMSLDKVRDGLRLLIADAVTPAPMESPAG